MATAVDPRPVCGEPVAQRSGGRPAVYCGQEHRRDVVRLRRILPQLEAEAATAEQLAASSAKDKIGPVYARRDRADELAAELAEVRETVARADALTR